MTELPLAIILWCFAAVIVVAAVVTAVAFIVGAVKGLRENRHAAIDERGKLTRTPR